MTLMTTRRVGGTFVLLTLFCALPVGCQTVTLQQGTDGYDGCVTETISRTPKAQAAPAGVLALRGSRNYLRLRFALPAGLRTKRLARARRVLEVPDDVCPMNFTQWTWEPAVLLKARRNLGETIEALTKLITPGEMLAARKARKDAEIRRQREMLKVRAKAARATQEK